MISPILSLHPDQYQRHRLHTQSRDWAETNCYMDVWIELLHAWGFDPLAAMPFTLGIDFEGDQWTFFKLSLADLHDLYGLEVQELAIWRPLVTHVDEQVRLGRPVLVELDSFYLPDTVGTAYQQIHQKSTVAVVAIDREQQRLGYFHGQGYYELHGADFVQVFRLNSFGDAADEISPLILPPYAELVKRHPDRRPSDKELVHVSMELLRKQLRRLPAINPLTAFQQRLEQDLGWLMSGSLELFHQYSFATLRQFGACYELAANYLLWLQDHTSERFETEIASLRALSTGAKTFQFQLARSMARKKPLNGGSLTELAGVWSDLTHRLKARFA